jgi:hypothetical protein
MNYQELTAAVTAYADRQDVEVAANMDIFIIMAEARMNRLLKTREQSHRALTPASADESFYSLPPDYAGMRHIKFLSDTTDAATISNVSYLSPDAMTARSGNAFAGQNYYTIIANQFQIFPTLDFGAAIEIVYYQKVPNLNNLAPTNWMLDSHPDIYLSSMLSEVESFIKNYDISTAWDSKTSRGISELDSSDELERWAGTALVTRVER